MDDRALDETYRSVLEDSRRRGELGGEPEDVERRRHPRIRVDPGALPTELDPWVFAIDISISGMAFFSDEPVATGEQVTIALGESPSVAAEVVDCHEEQPVAPYLPVRYRLHCRFADEEQGKRLLVTIKELEHGGPAAS